MNSLENDNIFVATLKITNLNILHSAEAESGKYEEYIGKGPAHHSIRLYVCPVVCPCTFLHDGCMDFLYIGYHDQMPSAAHASKIGKILVIMAIFSINFQCLLCLYFVQLSGTKHC